MVDTYKEIIQSNNKDKIMSEFLSLIDKDKKQDSIKFLYKLILYSIDDNSTLSKNIKPLIISIKENYNNNIKMKIFLDAYLIDTLWIIGFNMNNQVSNQNINEHDRIKAENYKNLINLFLNEKMINKIELIEKLEEPTLNQIGLIDSKDFKNKFTRINTKSYEQTKFNLLREESEGYSELITFLFDINELTIKLEQKEIETILNKLIKIIGYFNLDSYRVLDIAIEVFKYSPFNINYIKIFDILNKKILLPIFDFKFSENPFDKKLMIIAAQLIHFNFISLDSFLPHINPPLSTLQSNFVKKYQTMHDYIETALNEEIKFEINSYIDSNLSLNKSANYFCDFHYIISKAINWEGNQNKKNGEGIIKSEDKINQIYLLLECFVVIKDKNNFLKIYNLIKDFYDPFENIGVIYELCELIKWMIKPLSSQNNNIDKIEGNNYNEFTQCYNFNEFVQKIPEILNILNIGLSKDQILFQKLIMILNKNISEVKNNFELFEKLFTDIIFPSLSLMDPCPSLLNSLWNFLSNFDYITRYTLYEKWLTISYKVHPYLIIKSIVVWKEIQKWQKGLSQENARKHGRILQIISNSNPLIVFDSIIRIIILYENQITTIINTLTFCSYLSYDVITFTICKLLQEKRSNIDQENIGIDKTFQNFSLFISLFFKKYYNSELNGIINYIIDKFNTCPSDMDIFILREMISNMCGIFTQEELNENQISIETGGYKLYLKYKNSDKDLKSFKKPTMALMKIIKSNNNLINLFLLLNIQKRKILYSQKIKFQLMSFIYDQIYLINLQFQKLLYYYGKKEYFCKILEKINVDTFIKKYHFKPEVVFSLLRKQNKKIYELSNEEYVNSIKYYKDIYDNYILHKKDFLENEFDALYVEKDPFINEFYKSIWNSITPEFYFIFNSLELNDIYFPLSEYNKQITDLTNKLKASANVTSEKIKTDLEGLTSEKDNLSPHYKKVLDFLDKKFVNIFPSQNANYNNNTIPMLIERDNKENEKEKEKEKSINTNNTNLNNLPITSINKNELTKNLFQYLFYPRILLSKDDALYAQKIIDLLILSPGNTINTIDIMNKIPKYLLKIIICITESEAENVGLFLNAFLNMIQSYQEEKTWEEKCKKNISFSRKLDEVVLVELKDFKNAFNEVLKKLTNSIEKMMENEKELSNIRNIIVMINKIPLIPPNKESANSFYKVLSDIHQKNPKFILLESYMNVLVNKFKLDNDEKKNESENDIDNNKKDKEKMNNKDNNINNKQNRYKRDGNRDRDKSHESKRSLKRFHDKDRRRRDKDRNRDMEKSKERQKERSRDRERERDKKDEKNFENRRYKSERTERSKKK